MGELQTTQKKKPLSIEMYLRKVFKWLIDPIAQLFLKIGISPNMITGIGFLLSTVSAFLLGNGNFTLAGIFLLIGAPLDVVDGSMARMLGTPTAYGSFIDSVTDRYSELVVLGGMLFFYSKDQNQIALLLVFLAAAGSVLVSYIKSRAESLGYTAKVGLLTRVERLIVLIPCLIFNIPMVALWILAIFTHITAIQRLLYVRKQILISK
jgi:CDP-diacylglycerol--glycerol-3-phosphate 3-phosphatidyltransferase